MVSIGVDRIGMAITVQSQTPFTYRNDFTLSALIGASTFSANFPYSVFRNSGFNEPPGIPAPGTPETE